MALPSGPNITDRFLRLASEITLCVGCKKDLMG
jgi:hypothetical protein